MTTNKNAIINHSREINTLYKIVDKLEQRISTLEKKLEPKPKQLEFPFPELRNNV